MQETLATTDDPDISLISDYFKETFEIRRNFVKTHNTTEILTEYPALQLHSCVSIRFYRLGNHSDVQIRTFINLSTDQRVLL
jgi:hypothetical protein